MELKRLSARILASGKRLRSSLRDRGIRGTVVHYAWVITVLVRNLTPAALRSRAQQKEKDRAFQERRETIDAQFDSAHGLDTGRRIELVDLTIEGENDAYRGFYQAVFPDQFRRWISAVDIEPREFTFIDIGAGKGRALFLAQDLGFKEVIGVEFAKELVEVCKLNICRRQASGYTGPSISLLHMDALHYSFPGEPTILFLNNPFREEVMHPFIDRVRLSLESRPRTLKILYGNPVCDEVVMAGIPGLRRVVRSQEFNAYEWIPPG